MLSLKNLCLILSLKLSLQLKVVKFVLYAFFKELKVKQGIEGYGTNA